MGSKVEPAVAPRGQRGNGRRQGRRPLQDASGSGGGGRCLYIKRGAAKKAAVTVTGSGAAAMARPLQEVGGGDGAVA